METTSILIVAITIIAGAVMTAKFLRNINYCIKKIYDRR